MIKDAKYDQFYTRPEVAEHCISVLEKLIPEENRYIYLEPSAGTGSFSLPLKKVLAFDIDPKHRSIVKANFLTIPKEKIPFETREVCTVGNPPFGWRSSLAIKFFNHCAEVSDTIAFIVPRTFRKLSVQNRLNREFWLIHDEDVPKDSFIFLGNPHHTTCCFQIWVRKPKKRKIDHKVKNDHIKFVKREESDFAIQRVGSKAGNIIVDVKNISEQMHYFIKNISKTHSLEVIIEVMRNLKLEKISNATAGVRSISKTEIVKAFDKAFKK